MTKTIAPWVLLGLVGMAFLMPLPCLAQAAPQDLSPDSAVAQEYSQREAASSGLEEFAGGAHAGIIVLAIVLAAAIVILAILIPW